MKFVGTPRLLVRGLFAGLALCGAALSLRAQNTTLVIDSATRTSGTGSSWTYSTWKPLFGNVGSAQTSTDGYMIDPINDQQTGQYDSDFASGTGTNGAALPGFLVTSGTIAGVEHIGFRIMMNEFKTTGNLVNIRVGFDGDLDGTVDLFMGPSLQQNQYGLVFQGVTNPTSTAVNTSPSTTSLTNAFYPTSAGVGNARPFTATNFSNIELTAANIATYYPGWTMQDGKNTGDNDAMISFAIPLADINAALAAAGETFTITADTLLRWVAFTATQNNSINQDVYGLPKITQSNGVGDIVYAAFLPPMTSNGKPVPEPATYGLLLGAGLGGFLLLRRRPSRSRAA